ncbi:energy-coupling factor ABC transporter ATP-binding protein [Oceanobacillus neutriphilus]|uniref:ABC transporter ATP-binding protein n=1 Tax=Oceanobacillus neutriphilus TaxID=531815 RepID=A0ABQ2NPS2_9BACI|nr:ABC transporter ATP-binding protein [Oceanobacillus neutriphilus]GGP07703.1 ABC transporter ATP-binding protein [Oceanobacillus neutriphilus]
MSFIQIKDVSFVYPNEFTAVHKISASIEKGEKLAIVGQNGAGKTTTVKMMNGLLKPTKGDIEIDGLNTKDYTTAQISRHVGYVFQNPDDQIFHSDVYSEIAYGPKTIGLSDDEISSRVYSVAELVGIDGFLDENPYNLPFSTRKFVTIACVLVMDVDVVILDEPTAGQDHVGMVQISKLIDYLQKKNKTVITITHDMEFVVNNFERVIVMANKQIIADKNKREIFWDNNVIEESNIKQPYISELANDMNMGNRILSIDEFVEHVFSNKKEGATV